VPLAADDLERGGQGARRRRLEVHPHILALGEART
jgi:hypothetical protein